MADPDCNLPAGGAGNAPPGSPFKIVSRFVPHAAYPELHKHLNYNFSLPLPEVQRVFVCGTADLLPDAELGGMIRFTVSQLIRSYASQTSPGTAAIIPLIQAANFFVDAGQVRTPLDAQSLAISIDEVLSGTKNFVDLTMTIGHFFLDESQGPVTCLDWTKFSTTAFAPHVLPQFLSAADIAAAVAGAIPPPASATELADAFAAAYRPVVAAAAAAAGDPQGARPAVNQNPTMAEMNKIYGFNTRALPPDVRTRYQRKLEKKLVVGSSIRAPFQCGT